MAPTPPESLSDALAAEVTESSFGSIVRLRGEADLSGSPALLRLLLEVPGSRITVEIAELSFIDAAGLGAFVVASRELARAGRQLAVLAPRPSVARVFDVAGLQHLLASPAA